MKKIDFREFFREVSGLGIHLTEHSKLGSPNYRIGRMLQETVEQFEEYVGENMLDMDNMELELESQMNENRKKDRKIKRLEIELKKLKKLHTPVKTLKNVGTSAGRLSLVD